MIALRARTALLATFPLVLLACGEPGDADAAGRRAQPTEEPSPFEPTTAERVEILAAVQQVFDALRGEPELLAGVVAPDVVMYSTQAGSEGTPSVATATVESLTERIRSSPTPMTERMWDPEVRVSGDLATVWTPYDFYLGEALSHCGVDVVTLIRTADGWRIVALSWSRQRPPECALHPEGPPG